MLQNYILISFFLNIRWLPDDVVCKIAILADDTALESSYDKPCNLLQQVEIGCELYFDLNFLENIFFSISHFLIFKCQYLVIKLKHKKLLSRISLRKVVSKIWNSLHKSIFTLKSIFSKFIYCNEFQFCEMMPTSRNLKM